MHNSEIIIYQTSDGLTKIDVRMEGETLWLNQAQIAQLFGRERSVITKHIRNIFSEDELDEKRNVQNLHIPNSDKPVAFYNLDVILAVGYRVKSQRGTPDRRAPVFCNIGLALFAPEFPQLQGYAFFVPFGRKKGLKGK